MLDDELYRLLDNYPNANELANVLWTMLGDTTNPTSLGSGASINLGTIPPIQINNIPFTNDTIPGIDWRRPDGSGYNLSIDGGDLTFSEVASDGTTKTSVIGVGKKTGSGNYFPGIITGNKTTGDTTDVNTYLVDVYLAGPSADPVNVMARQWYPFDTAATALEVGWRPFVMRAVDGTYWINEPAWR